MKQQNENDKRVTVTFQTLPKLGRVVVASAKEKRAYEILDSYDKGTLNMDEIREEYYARKPIKSNK